MFGLLLVSLPSKLRCEERDMRIEDSSAECETEITEPALAANKRQQPESGGRDSSMHEPVPDQPTEANKDAEKQQKRTVIRRKAQKETEIH